VCNEQGVPERVRPEDITTTAQFTVEGELDDISGSGQTKAAHGLCSSIPKAKQQHLEVKGAGHYGIFSGRRWRETTYPAVKSFILAHNKTASKTNSSKPVASSPAKRRTPAVTMAAAKTRPATAVKKTAARK